MADSERYVVRDWMIGNATMLCIWDSVDNKRRHESPLWLTKALAQKYADQLNGKVVTVDV